MYDSLLHRILSVALRMLFDYSSNLRVCGDPYCSNIPVGSTLYLCIFTSLPSPALTLFILSGVWIVYFNSFQFTAVCSVLKQNR